MTDNRIIRIEQWDRRRALTKQFGYTAAIVYAGTTACGAKLIACDHRIRVKTWANRRLGPPCHVIGHQEYVYTNSPWYQGYTDRGEYVIAFCDAKIRDWALLL